LSDKAIERLRGSSVPDLSGTRYVLRELIARGGMGVVYAAEDEKLHRRVALKVLDTAGSNAELTQRLIREARILAQLEHPGIVPVHDVGTLPDGQVFYTMKFVEGLRLDEYVKQLDSLPQRLRLFFANLRRGGIRACSKCAAQGLEAGECDGRLVWRSAGDGLGACENLARASGRRGNGCCFLAKKDLQRRRDAGDCRDRTRNRDGKRRATCRRSKNEARRNKLMREAIFFRWARC